MDVKLVKLNHGFMIGKPLLTTSNPLDITSSGITSIFWRRTKQTIIAKSKTPSFNFQELEPAFKANVGSEKMMLY